MAEYSSITDLPPGVLVTAIAAGVALIAAHVWLCRRNPVWLGAIVPVVYAILAALLTVAVPASTGMLVGHAICILALLVIWWAGEDRRHKRRAVPPSNA